MVCRTCGFTNYSSARGQRHTHMSVLPTNCMAPCTLLLVTARTRRCMWTRAHGAVSATVMYVRQALQRKRELANQEPVGTCPRRRSRPWFAAALVALAAHTVLLQRRGVRRWNHAAWRQHEVGQVWTRAPTVQADQVCTYPMLHTHVTYCLHAPMQHAREAQARTR